MKKHRTSNGSPLSQLSSINSSGGYAEANGQNVNIEEAAKQNDYMRVNFVAKNEKKRSEKHQFQKRKNQSSRNSPNVDKTDRNQTLNMSSYEEA